MKISTILALAAIAIGLFTIIGTLSTFYSKVRPSEQFFASIAKATVTSRIMLLFMGTMALAGGTLLLCHHKKPSISLDIVTLLAPFNEKKSYHKVMQFFRGEELGPRFQYDFYYNLASMTEEMVTLKEKSDWETFLNTINGYKVNNITIDSSFELRRLKNDLPKLEIEMLIKEHVSNEDMKALLLICQAAFGTQPNLEHFFKKEEEDNTTPYVIRDQSSQKILAVICLQEMMMMNGKKTLAIHTLAHTPPAVKMRITALLNNYFLKQIQMNQYNEVICWVKMDNDVAKDIYIKLGFKVTHCDWQQQLRFMHLKAPKDSNGGKAPCARASSEAGAEAALLEPQEQE